MKDSREYHVELFPGQNSELVVSNDRMPNLEILKLMPLLESLSPV